MIKCTGTQKLPCSMNVTHTAHRMIRTVYLKNNKNQNKKTSQHCFETVNKKGMGKCLAIGPRLGLIYLLVLLNSSWWWLPASTFYVLAGIVNSPILFPLFCSFTGLLHKFIHYSQSLPSWIPIDSFHLS